MAQILDQLRVDTLVASIINRTEDQSIDNYNTPGTCRMISHAVRPVTPSLRTAFNFPL